MKKLALLISAVMMCASAAVFAADSTPVKISLFPKLGFPPAQTVHGLDLGVIATKVDEVKGVQLGWFYAGTRDNMVGLQNGIVASGTKVTGAQLGFVTFGEDVTGLQYGFVTKAEKVTGVQLGFVNITERMKGVQVGLVNIIKQGIVPAMVFVNANF